MSTLLKIAMTLATLLAGFGSAAAQLPVDVPRLPVTDRLRDTLTDPLNQTLDELEDVRQDTLDTLLRRNRDVLERGPDRTVILRDQITTLRVDDADLTPLLAAGFTVLRGRALGGLPARLHVLQVPSGLSTVRALALAREIDPAGTYDFNHVYARSGHAGVVMATAAQAGNGPAVRVGLIDTGVATAHAHLRSARIETRAFHDGDYLPAAHGTGVASLLVGPTGGTLYSADIYGAGPTGGSLEALVAALGWMAEVEVGVINVSLVGPDNALLRSVSAMLTARGHIMVAAVGNDGPSADPLYPAAYPGVVGVTGVDRRGRVLPEACRGEHVDFAALGRDVEVANLPDGETEARGTSFAAPQVAALLAAGFDRPDPDVVVGLIAALAARAEDAGRRGRDVIYGDGIIQRDATYSLAGQH
ncbi:S8 family serine peptidase [Maricaulis sp.]|uniref:S8 family serine peptidase n=1 Tax=Maricaulis sp. TaxID=1486257 RepID=UPI002B26ED0C|nr:S8 family serine peptidase [Maricaulis sp.]